MPSNSAGKLGARHAADRRAACNKRFNVLDRAPYLLCVLAADPHAVAAADAALGDDLRLALRDADGLGRAFPHACVAYPAALFDRGDETERLHTRPPRRACNPVSCHAPDIRKAVRGSSPDLSGFADGEQESACGALSTSQTSLGSRRGYQSRPRRSTTPCARRSRPASPSAAAPLPASAARAGPACPGPIGLHPGLLLRR